MSREISFSNMFWKGAVLLTQGLALQVAARPLAAANSKPEPQPDRFVRVQGEARGNYAQYCGEPYHFNGYSGPQGQCCPYPMFPGAKKDGSGGLGDYNCLPPGPYCQPCWPTAAKARH